MDRQLVASYFTVKYTEIFYSVDLYASGFSDPKWLENIYHIVESK